MDILEAIAKRKSIRNFLPEKIDREILEKILRAGQMAPSAMNTQPWEFFVLTGDVLGAVAEENVNRLKKGIMPNPDHLVVGWPQDSIFRTRQVELAKDLFKLMDIKREDTLARGQWLERGFRFFNAPVAIIVVADKNLSENGPLLDLGCAIENICLAALGFGLGACIEDQGSMYPDVLREKAGIPDNKRVIIAIALGRPDPDFPANAIESRREPLENIITWKGFSD